MTIRSYRDLDVWRKALDLVETVYRLTSELPGDERFGLVAQLRRAAVSVPANVAEGHGRSTSGEYLNHLSVARGSLNEIRTLTEVCRRLRMADETSLREIDATADDVARLLWGLQRAVRERGTGSRAQGRGHREQGTGQRAHGTGHGR